MPMTSRTERFDAFIRKSPPVLLTVLFLFLAVTIGGTIAFFKGAYSWYDHRYNWREREYAKLYALRAGFTPEKFEEALGAPVFRRLSRDEQWVEATFRGRSYWVQIVWRRGSTSTSYYAVTSCSRSFNPTFRLPDDTAVKLNDSTLASISLNSGPVASADYFFPGATADAHFYDFLVGGNPENYKSFAWGFDDACLNLPPWTNYALRSTLDFVGFRGRYQGPTEPAPRPIAQFRESIPVNTYAETAPAFRFSATAQAFQVGADRILVRTVTFPNYGPPRHVQASESGYDPFAGTGLRSEPRRIQDVAGCLNSPLVMDFVLITPGTVSNDPSVEPGLLRRMRGYAGRRFLVVSGNFPNRRIVEQRVVLLFAHTNLGALQMASVVKRREPGVARIAGTVVMLWQRPPNHQEWSIVDGCM
jgi:hypothetical protein